MGTVAEDLRADDQGWMAQWLRPRAALSEDLGWFLGTPMVDYSNLQFYFLGIQCPLLVSIDTRRTYGPQVYRHTGETPILIKYIFLS